MAACSRCNTCEQSGVHIATKADGVDGDVVVYCLLGVGIAVGALLIWCE